MLCYYALCHIHPTSFEEVAVQTTEHQAPESRIAPLISTSLANNLRSHGCNRSSSSDEVLVHDKGLTATSLDQDISRWLAAALPDRLDDSGGKLGLGRVTPKRLVALGLATPLMRTGGELERGGKTNDLEDTGSSRSMNGETGSRAQDESADGSTPQVASTRADIGQLPAFSFGDLQPLVVPDAKLKK